MHASLRVVNAAFQIGALLTAILHAASAQEEPAAPTGIALTIGLNSVDPDHYSGWTGDLSACEFDADDMASIASSRGFSTRTLHTQAATRSAVRDEISEAANTLAAGDIFMISYSGHGGQLPDQNGDELDNEDETWCLFDGQIMDDELAALWAQFPAGVRVLVFSDSCHSGTVTRYREYAQFVRNVPPMGAANRTVALARFAPLVSVDAPADTPHASPVRSMPDHVARAVFRQNREMYAEIGRETPSERDSEENLAATVLLISGCQDNQLSLDGTFNGLFTGTLKAVWNNGIFRGDYRDFHQAIVSRMPAYQSPNYYLTGAANPTFERETPFSR